MVWMRRRCAISPLFGTCFKTRWRISAAALMVKVMATISSGFCTTPRSLAKRLTSRSVLPEPAGAWTMNERLTSSAASRCFASAIMGRGPQALRPRRRRGRAALLALLLAHQDGAQAQGARLRDHPVALRREGRHRALQVDHRAGARRRIELGLRLLGDRGVPRRGLPVAAAPVWRERGARA